MSEEKMREQFERHPEFAGCVFDRDGDGYESEYTQGYWVSFKAGYHSNTPTAASYDLAYARGLKAGWNLGVDGNSGELNRRIEQLSAEAVRQLGEKS